MQKRPATIRFDAQLYKKAQREAQKRGLTFSGIMQLLLYEFVERSTHAEETNYPKGYLEMLGREVDEMRELDKKGKLKTYNSSKELFDDILGR